MLGSICVRSRPVESAARIRAGLAAALAAFYQRIPVGHVEAGLRTHDFYYPFPEEMNRVVADSLSTYHFAPTPRSKENLLREGASEASITVTGNTVIDALLDAAGRGGAPETQLPTNTRLVLVTAHRRENFGTHLNSICRAVLELAHRFPDCRFVYPVHPNPPPSLRQTVGKEVVHFCLRVQQHRLTPMKSRPSKPQPGPRIKQGQGLVYIRRETLRLTAGWWR